MLEQIITFILTVVAVTASIITIVCKWQRIKNWLETYFIPKHRYNWDEIPKKIEYAKDRVFILQTWIPALRRDIKCWKKALKRYNVHFRILLIDPELVPYRLRCRERVSSLLTQNINDISLLAEDINIDRITIEGRFYSCLPFGPIYVIDNTIYWGLYFADRDSMDGPAFRVSTNSELGQLIMSSFDVIWDNSYQRSGDLIMPGAKIEKTRRDELELEIEKNIDKYSKIMEECKVGEHVKAVEGLLLIIRHAETDLNEAEIFTGDLDIGINADGKLSSRALRETIVNLRWDKTYCSPMRRAIDTLKEIFKGEKDNIEIRNELRERGMGDVEGYSKHTYQKSLKIYEGIDLINAFFTKANGGESYADVFDRVVELLKDIVKDLREGKNILVCSHEGPIRMINLAINGFSFTESTKEQIENCKPICYLLRR